MRLFRRVAALGALSASVIVTLLAPLSLAYTELSDDSLRTIPLPGSDFNVQSGALLAPLLIPRVPGTPGNAIARRHIVDFFHKNLPEWTIEYSNSSQTTPESGGKLVPFINIIATRDPPNTKEGHVGRLALVAHYDSLSKPKGFIGATDSAAPCAMLLHAARSLDAALTRKWAADRLKTEDDLEDSTSKGIQIIFTDGEEAFHSWTDTDSLYGARAMAEEWEKTMYPASSTYKNKLRSIDLFVLLDLLGAHEDAIIPSWFLTTHWAYKGMASIEQRLRAQGIFKSSPNHHSKRSRADPARPKQEEVKWLPDADKTRFYPSLMGDDHVPFMARGVEILHLIPSRFPKVWHNMQGIPDDADALDTDKCEDWATLVTAFAASYMDLEGYLESTRKYTREEKSEL